MHIVFNMMSFTALGPWHERRVGTLQLLWHSLIFQLLLCVVALIITAGIYLVDPSWSNSCAVGFSGALELGCILTNLDLTPKTSRCPFRANDH